MEERSGSSGWLLPPLSKYVCFCLWLIVSPNTEELEVMKGISKLRSTGLPGANTELTHSIKQLRWRQLEMIPVLTRPKVFLSLVNITVPNSPVMADTPMRRLRREPLTPWV